MIEIFDKRNRIQPLITIEKQTSISHEQNHERRKNLVLFGKCDLRLN